MTPSASSRNRNKVCKKIKNNNSNEANVKEWNCDDVHRWLCNNQFKHIADLVAYDQKVSIFMFLLSVNVLINNTFR